MIPGQGVCAVSEGKQVLAGNPKLLKEHGVEIKTIAEKCADTEDKTGESKELTDASFYSTQKIQSKANPKQYIERGCTVTYVAIDGQYAGFIALSDTLREESTGMIDSLNSLGVQSVLLTGDHENAAKTIASQLHIKEVRANCLPEFPQLFFQSMKQFHIAAYPTGKGQLTEVIRSIIVRCQIAGVDLRCSTEADEETLRALEPDTIIVATGSNPLVLPKENHVQLCPGAKVGHFYTDGADYTLADGTEGSLRGYDNVVLAMGSRANGAFEAALQI